MLLKSNMFHCLRIHFRNSTEKQTQGKQTSQGMKTQKIAAVSKSYLAFAQYKLCLEAPRKLPTSLKAAPARECPNSFQMDLP